MKRIFEPNAYSREINSYWQTTATINSSPSLEQDWDCECVIIGSGITGLNAALALAENHGMESIILEAEQPGYGASGRNGGFCSMGGTKLTWHNQIKRFGEEEMKRFFYTQIEAIETVEENLKRYSIDADTHSNGETQLAHLPRSVSELKEEADFLKNRLGVSTNFIPKEELSNEGMNSPAFHGALELDYGFALNPLKYLAGLTKAAHESGIRIFGNSPAINITQEHNSYRVKTPNGTVKAKYLILATNGYSSDDIPNWLSGRFLPILTNILMTRPLSNDELTSQGWTSHQMCFDTRHLLHYFRLIPSFDGSGPRMMFGMRGGTSADPETSSKMRDLVRGNFESFFPEWKDIETPYFWSGLACMSRDLTCYTGPIGNWVNAWTSMAYHGNGVSMGSHTGRILADLVTGKLAHSNLPTLIRTPLKKFPFPSLRRTYLKAAYLWYNHQDR